MNIPEAVPNYSEPPCLERGDPSHGALPSGRSKLTRLAAHAEDQQDHCFSVVPLLIVRDQMSTRLTAGCGWVEKVCSELPVAGLSFASAGGPLLLLRLPEALALSLLKKEDMVCVCGLELIRLLYRSGGVWLVSQEGERVPVPSPYKRSSLMTS